MLTRFNDIIKVDNLEDLHQLKLLINDPEVTQVINLILSHFNEVNNFLIQENQNSSRSSEGMCLEVSRFFNKILKRKRINSSVLQGEIELTENSWLEHHISLVRLKNYWMTIDLSVDQIDCYKDVLLMVLICKPDRKSLGEAIKSAYKWWTSN